MQTILITSPLHLITQNTPPFPHILHYFKHILALKYYSVSPKMFTKALASK